MHFILLFGIGRKAYFVGFGFHILFTMKNFILKKNQCCLILDKKAYFVGIGLHIFFYKKKKYLKKINQFITCL